MADLTNEGTSLFSQIVDSAIETGLAIGEAVEDNPDAVAGAVEVIETWGERKVNRLKDAMRAGGYTSVAAGSGGRKIMDEALRRKVSASKLESISRKAKNRFPHDKARRRRHIESELRKLPTDKLLRGARDIYIEWRNLDPVARNQGLDALRVTNATMTTVGLVLQLVPGANIVGLVILAAAGIVEAIIPAIAGDLESALQNVSELADNLVMTQGGSGTQAQTAPFLTNPTMLVGTAHAPGVGFGAHHAAQQSINQSAGAAVGVLVILALIVYAESRT